MTVTASTNYDITRATVSGEGCSLSSDKKTLTVSNITGNGRSCAVTIPLKQYTLTMIVNNGSTSPSSAVIDHGGSKSYTISASTGYTTTGMTVSCTGSATKSVSGSTVTISNVTSTQTCTVNTVKKTYAVNVSSNNTSYGTVSPTSTTISHGSSATITLSPKTGYKYSSNNCGGTVSGNTMTISNITTAKTCTVTFAIKTYTVNVSVTNGSSSPTSKTINHGSNGTFTITASSGYKIDGATVSGTGCSLSGSTLTVSNVTSVRTCTVKITTIDITNSKYLYGKILADHPTVKVRNDFDDRYPDGASTITSGIIYKETSRIETTSGDLPVYYFARLVSDNWVSFAGLTWRILRTNEDGSIRLIYHAKLPTDYPDYFSMKFSNDAWGNSYMYGNSGGTTSSRTNVKDSIVKTYLEKWYEDNIKSSYDKYINYNTLFCVDRSSGWVTRLNSWIPSFKCGQGTSDALFSDASSDDLFSASIATKGNKKLKYPIGLITGDEASYAGYYGNTNGWYSSGVPVFITRSSTNSGYSGSPTLWTMSPGAVRSSCDDDGCTTIYGVVQAYIADGSNTGLMRSLNSLPNYNTAGVKPVISLKSCVTWSSGNGTASSPYEVSVTSSCSSAVN